MGVVSGLLNLLWFAGIVASLAFGYTNGLLALIAVFLFDHCLDFKAYRRHVEAMDDQPYDAPVQMTTTQASYLMDLSAMRES